MRSLKPEHSSSPLGLGRCCDFFAALLVFVVFGSFLLIRLPNLRHFHPDEVNWIRVSVYSFRTFFIERDFSDEGWAESFRTFGSYNPHVGKFLIGASLWLHEYRDFEGIIKWQKGKGLQWHIENGIVPSKETLYAARLPMVFLTAGISSLLFLLSKTIWDYFSVDTGYLPGFLVSVLFFVHPLTPVLGRRTGLDIPAVFFSVLTIFAVFNSGILHIRKRYEVSVVWMVLASTSLGLALSTKLNSLLVWIVVFAILGWEFLVVSADWQSKKWVLVKVISVVLIPILIFIALNPFLYGNVVQHTKHMFSLGSRVAGYRENNPRKALYSLSQKLGAFLIIGFGPFEGLLSMSFPDVALVILGLLVLSGYLIKIGKQPERDYVIVLLLTWSLLVGGGVLLWSPLAWERYYFPWVPISVVLQGLTLSWLFNLLWNFISKRNRLTFCIHICLGG